MGSGTYSSTLRSARAESKGFTTASFATMDSIFEQNKKGQSHDLMNPKDVTIREARDSAEHPNSLPIIVALDVTGSMRDVPIQLVKDGLPKLMTNIIQHGQPDPQLLFLAIGDHEVDRYPLQVGQFESSDEKLDFWLTSTYLEGGGGPNSGESYLLAHYFAANHTVTDHWEKRKQKGFLFTIGDEPGLESLPLSTIKSLMKNASGQTNFTDKELITAVQEKWNVYHIHITSTGNRESARSYWKQLLGDNCIVLDNHKDVANTISEIVTKNTVPVVRPETKKEENTTIML